MRPILNPQEWLLRCQNIKALKSSTARIFYSSVWGGYVQDPSLMMIPMEDHLVHRGDGVFEALKLRRGEIFLMKQHLDRLEVSSRALFLDCPHSRQELEEILLEMPKLVGMDEGIFRIFLSRGVGGYSANPYDSKGSQLTVVLCTPSSVREELYSQGASLGRSRIEVKSSFWAQIKSCNYLPNVLMKKEAVDRGFDFMVGFDEKGFMTEGSTENLFIVDENGILARPLPGRILRGTTLDLCFELAADLLKAGLIQGMVEKNISEENLIRAREVLVAGTTWDVVPVIRYENHSIGGNSSSGEMTSNLGKVGFGGPGPGPVAKELRSKLLSWSPKN